MKRSVLPFAAFLSPLLAATTTTISAASTKAAAATTSSLSSSSSERALSKNFAGLIDLPRAGGHHCENNAVVASWCGSGSTNPYVQCSIFPDSDEYLCSCLGDPAYCPTDCIGGGEPHMKTHHWIQCRNIPIDEPNYILKENPAAVAEAASSSSSTHCAENAVVASWCDESMNPKLECSLYVEEDEYACRCSKSVGCPDECVGGAKAIERTQFYTRCRNIPLDHPNYVLKNYAHKHKRKPSRRVRS